MGGRGLFAWLLDGDGRAGAPAVVHGERTLDYAELRSGAASVARVVETRSAGRRGPVAILGANSIEYVLALLGTLATGRAVAEINHHESSARIERILATLDPSLVIVDERSPEQRPVTPAPTLGFHELAEEIDVGSPEPCDAMRAKGADDDLAFVVFTSGTTGDPKGVVLSHGNVRAVCEAILDYLELDASDRYSLVLPLFHTYGKSVLLTTLRVGGTVHLDEGFENLPAFVAGLAERRITAFSGVPYHVHMLLRRAPLDRHDLSSLRRITISGSHIGAGALRELSERLPHSRVWFMYGLTESSTRACALPPERITDKPNSCGRPIRGVELAITDDDGRELPPGEVGEVRLRGPNVMQGYWRDPELTAETLEAGWLLTGDLGRVDEEGFLYLEGRRRDLIKVAGERIGAREIEDVIAEHPDVVECAVVGVEHPILGEVVRAYVVAPEGTLGENDLRAWCAERLTHHKIPRSFVWLDELPRTASGKIQKHRLADARSGGAPS
jgi:acyl-CoA synthetase (AMP-forming)/AMP-acid ligase II